MGWFHLPNKRLSDLGEPSTESVPIAGIWAPKEDVSSLASCLVGTLELYDTHSVPVRQNMTAVIVDGAPGGILAIRKAGRNIPQPIQYASDIKLTRFFFVASIWVQVKL